jgi:NhaA family Na+:H+ antiporter
MAIFFLIIGLEVKREVLEGQLSTRAQVMLPTVAAIGGLIMPALIFVFFNYNQPATLRGWAIPAATDIAFALGMILLLGKRVPQTLKVTLVALAIIDDIAAILIIAIFYNTGVSLLSLGLASICLAGLMGMNRLGVGKLSPFIWVGVVLWLCVLQSGVHATLAGFVLGLTIPLKTTTDYSPLRVLEHALHPWVAFLILPLFALANAGISLAGVGLNTWLSPLTLGIALGLFLGKQIGVMLFSWVAVQLKLCTLPQGVNWRQYYGMALLTGIGFTMSLFIGNLAFQENLSHIKAVRIGVLSGSILAASLGVALLHATCKKTKPVNPAL